MYFLWLRVLLAKVQHKPWVKSEHRQLRRKTTTTTKSPRYAFSSFISHRIVLFLATSQYKEFSAMRCIVCSRNTNLGSIINLIHVKFIVNSFMDMLKWNLFLSNKTLNVCFFYYTFIRDFVESKHWANIVKYIHDRFIT